MYSVGNPYDVRDMLLRIVIVHLYNTGTFILKRRERSVNLVTLVTVSVSERGPESFKFGSDKSCVVLRPLQRKAEHRT